MCKTWMGTKATHRYLGDGSRDGSGICDSLRDACDVWKEVLERIHCVDGGCSSWGERRKGGATRQFLVRFL